MAKSATFLWQLHVKMIDDYTWMYQLFCSFSSTRIMQLNDKLTLTHIDLNIFFSSSGFEVANVPVV